MNKNEQTEESKETREQWKAAKKDENQERMALEVKR